MNHLAMVSLLLGSTLVLLSVPLLAAPAAARNVLVRFPRNRIAGCVLAAGDLVWAGILLWRMPLGWFDQYKGLLVVLTPVTIVLVWIFMDELLAARSLGGLLVLVPAPILAAARWHGAPLRLVVVIVAYAMAVIGMVLIVSPYKLRQWFGRRCLVDRSCRTWGSVGTALGLSVILLGLLAF